MNLAAVSSRLQEDPNSIPWAEKVALVDRIAVGLSSHDKCSGQVADVLTLLAGDSKWEVRKAVADLLHLVPDAHFGGLAGKLGTDDNAYVRNSAQKALERRSQSRATGHRTGRGLKKAESEIERVARAHGPDVAKLVREQAVRLYEGLVGASVHELRAVLSAMRANLDSLFTEIEGGNSTKAATKYAPRLRASLQFMEQLLADMRLYSQLPPEKRHTELLAGMVQESLAMVQSEFRGTGRSRRGVKVSVHVPPDLALPVFRAQVILAVRNLIKNAYEAVLAQKPRSTTGKITIEACQQGKWAVLRVEDNGMGLNEQELGNVRQFIPGNTSKQGGTGFGLPIAQRYVAFHGGKLEIESEDGKGTVVEIRLPMESKTGE